MKPKLNESIHHRLVPIYGMRLLLVVTDDVFRSRVARNAIFGEPRCDNSGWAGLCVWDENFRVALIFDRAELCHNLIAHEIFHVTHRILERNNVAFGVHNHEPFAHLCGWLTGAVYTDLKNMGESVLPSFSPRKYAKGEPRLNLAASADE